jgi:hypothetical protein
LKILHDDNEALDYLIVKYQQALERPQKSGSLKDAKDQLTALTMAADAMAKALDGLQEAASASLQLGYSPQREALWRKAGGEALLPELQRFIKEGPLDLETAGFILPEGNLKTHYRIEEFKALARLCREESKDWADEEKKGKGSHSAAERFYGTPKMTLAENCAARIYLTGQGMTRLNELVKIVAELGTNKPINSRFAERECGKVRARYLRTTQTLQTLITPSV